MWSPRELDDGWLRPRPSAAGIRRDVVLAVVLAVAALVSVELMRSTPSGEAVNTDLTASYLGSVGIALPLALRRVFPVAVMVVCSVVFYVLGDRVPIASASAVVQVALFMAFYAAWAWSRHRRRLLLVSAVVVLAMFVWVAQLIAENPASAAGPGRVSSAVALAVLTVAINVVYFFGAIAWGLVSHRDAHRRQQLVDQAEALRREQHRNAERAVAEDRLRIARDLHDAVAHHVTGIGVQAAAARHVLDRDPEGSRGALAAIEDSSRSAVREMHHIVGLLRDESEPEDRPGLAALETLAGPVDGDRLTVRLRRVGTAVDVPDGVGTALFRTAQEALTNVRRHSTAREAEMVLRFLDAGDRAVELEVVDAGGPRPTANGAGGGRRGFGLQGVRERAAVHDGVVDIGPRPEGGFRVRVRFVLPATTDPAPDPAIRSTTRPVTHGARDGEPAR